MNATLERLVWQRARSCCEYCQLPQAFSPLPHAIDPIISRQQRGPTVAENLALACFFCNSYKGPNIAAINPLTGRIVRLFHPRKDRGSRHFAWNGPILVGRTVPRSTRRGSGPAPARPGLSPPARSGRVQDATAVRSLHAAREGRG